VSSEERKSKVQELLKELVIPGGASVFSLNAPGEYAMMEGKSDIFPEKVEVYGTGAWPEARRERT